ncbi:MAG: hypothetical protein DMF62_08440 [Acidobacteria bacterium]|nr:MAG: hypothetical protein DMF62_08440 [Acidobacteriota bacterium]
MMIFFGRLFQFADIDVLRKQIEMEHRVILAMLTEKGNVFTEIHVLEMVRDKTPVTPLNSFAEFAYYLGRWFAHKCN